MALPISEEFFRFLREHEQSLSPAEKKLANLIIDNFDDIAKVGTHGGRRSLLLNDIIGRKGTTAPDQLSLPSATTASNNSQGLKLHQLTVENFRGFSDRTDINLSKQVILVYGPNGSGKSSFCEAIEYALLGYINEAAAKRIDPTKYIKNLNTGKGTSPILSAIAADGSQTTITADRSKFEFCFIERNRIEGFARVSALTPSNQSELLNTLFGLTEFNDFVDGFAKDIERWIDVKGQKQNLIREKRQALETVQKNIKGYSARISEIEQLKTDLVNKSGETCKFEALNDIVTRRIKANEAKKMGLNAVQIDLASHTAVSDKIREISTLVDSLQALLGKYETQKEKISFKKMYEAVLELEVLGTDFCPACNTPVGQVVKNPFSTAKAELSNLRAISELEMSIDSAISSIASQHSAVVGDLKNRAIIGAKEGFTDIPQLKDVGSFQRSSDWSKYSQILSEVSKSLLKDTDNGQKLDELIAKKNKEIQDSERIRKELQAAIDKDNLILREIIEIEADLRTRNESISAWTQEIADFEVANSTLITEAEAEKSAIAMNIDYVNAYNLLIEKLHQYRTQLPLTLVSNLNTSALEFYNAINEHDETFEKLSTLQLPRKPEEPIEISFLDNPTLKVNALQILSEGHLRILGLAILLAKNIQEHSEFLIFDDVVNAIDDDHRGGIRKLLFTNPAFSSKQIVVTSHGPEFIKDISNQFTPKFIAENVENIQFLVPRDRKITISSHAFNYLQRAGEMLAKSDHRGVLDQCRKALENATDKLWRKLGKKYSVNLSVSIRQPGGQPDLKSLADGLRTYMSKNLPETGKEVIELLTELTKDNNWRHLNKGTHEESELKEFDPEIVRDIFTKLTTLNELATNGTKF